MAVSKTTTPVVLDKVTDPVLDAVGSNNVVLSTDPVLDPVGSTDTQLTPVEISAILTPEQIAANEAAADALFDTANAGVTERVEKEEAILNMTNEELNAEYGITVSEAIGILRDALSRSKSPFNDKMNGLLDKIEETSQL